MDSLAINGSCSRSNYNAIDAAKLLMSICVVAIHTKPLIHCSNQVVLKSFETFFSLAVPFFFIASGFFLGQKLKYANPTDGYHDLKPILQNLKKNISMYLLWTVIYLPLTIAGFRLWDDSPIEAIIKFIRNLFIVGENYNSWILWYLLSTIYALLYVYLMLKRGASVNSITILGFVIFVASLFITRLSVYEGELSGLLNLLQKVISVTIKDGRIFKGLFFIPLGLLFATKQLPSFRIGIVLFFGGFLLTYFTSGIISGVSVSICSAGLFVTVANLNLPSSTIYPKLRSISTDIYLLHMIVFSVYYQLRYGRSTFGVDCFIFTVFASIICSLLLTVFRKRKRLFQS